MLIFGALLAATGLHFFYYWNYVDHNPWSVALLTGRNILLILLSVLSWAWLLPRRSLP